MSTPTVTPEVELTDPSAPVAVAPVAPVAVPEQKRYEYQPTDEHDRPIGGKQVILYTTQEELIQKLTKNHTESIKGMRDVKRKARLGTVEVETLPTDLERLPATVQF